VEFFAGGTRRALVSTGCTRSFARAC